MATKAILDADEAADGRSAGGLQKCAFVICVELRGATGNGDNGGMEGMPSDGSCLEGLANVLRGY